MITHMMNPQKYLLYKGDQNSKLFFIQQKNFLFSIAKMKLLVILTLLAYLALVSPTEIDRGSRATSLKQKAMVVRSVWNDIKLKTNELKNARTSIKHRCVWKICSRPVERPVLADDFKEAMNATGNWWNNLLRTKQQPRPSGQHYRITDVLFNGNRQHY